MLALQTPRRCTSASPRAGLEALRANVWDKGLGVRVLQLFSGHCNLGSSYLLHRFFHLEETAEYEWCDEETVERYQLLCQSWACLLRAQTIGDLVDWSSAATTASQPSSP